MEFSRSNNQRFGRYSFLWVDVNFMYRSSYFVFPAYVCWWQHLLERCLDAGRRRPSLEPMNIVWKITIKSQTVDSCIPSLRMQFIKDGILAFQQSKIWKIIFSVDRCQLWTEISFFLSGFMWIWKYWRL